MMTSFPLTRPGKSWTRWTGKAQRLQLQHHTPKSSASHLCRRTCVSLTATTTTAAGENHKLPRVFVCSVCWPGPYGCRYQVLPGSPGRTEVGEGMSIARMVLTSPFLSSHVGISRMGVGAHWVSCPGCRNTSVNPCSHVQTPSCRGQHSSIIYSMFMLLEYQDFSLLSSYTDDVSLPHLTTERLGGKAWGVTWAVAHRRGHFRTASSRWKTKESHLVLFNTISFTNVDESKPSLSANKTATKIYISEINTFNLLKTCLRLPWLKSAANCQLLTISILILTTYYSSHLTL